MLPLWNELLLNSAQWLHFQGRQLCQKVLCFPSGKGYTLKGNNLILLEAFFFPFRLDPFSEGAWCAESQARSQSCLPCKNRRKSTECIKSPSVKVLYIPGSEVIKLFSCSTQLSMKFVLLINFKLLRIANSFLIAKHSWAWKFVC